MKVETTRKRKTMSGATWKAEMTTTREKDGTIWKAAIAPTNPTKAIPSQRRKQMSGIYWKAGNWNRLFFFNIR